MKKEAVDSNVWAREAVRQFLVRLFTSMAMDYELLAKLAARRK